MSIYIQCSLITLQICLIVCVFRYIYNEYRWKKLLKYLSPYYLQLSIFFKEHNVKENELYPLAYIYKLILEFMNKEDLINVEYNSYLYELIYKEESKSRFIHCDCTNKKYKFTYSLTFINNLFKYKEHNIKLN
jgi:hypothetical protein